MAQMVKRLPAMQETRVWSLSQKDPLEKEMATDSHTLAWKILWMEEPGRLQSMGWKESDTTEWPHHSTIRISTSAKEKKKKKRYKPDHLIGSKKWTQDKQYHVYDLSPHCFDFFSLYTHLPDHALSGPVTLLYWLPGIMSPGEIVKHFTSVS